MRKENNKTLFSRESSGFVRGFNIWDIFVFNVLGYATGLSLATNPTILGGLYPNANIYWTLLFGVILSIFTGILYGIFAAIFPRSGGDYIYNSRTLSPMIGFVASWGFTWSQIYGIGTFSGWAIRDAISPALITSGYTLNKLSLIEIGHNLSGVNNIVIGGVIVLIVCFLFSVISQSKLRKILNIFFIIAVISSILMVFSFWTIDNATFIENFNRFMYKSSNLPNAYQYVLDIASKNGLVLNENKTILDSFYALPIGFLIFFGFTYSVYVGGEVREPSKTQKWGILLALLFGFLISIIGMGRYYSVVGYDFNNAIPIVSSLDTNPLPAGGSMIFMSGLIIQNPILNIIMTFGSALWFILLPIVMTIICIRNIFAYSMDRLLPNGFTAKINNQPVAASIFILSSAFIVLILMNYFSFPYINYITLFSLCYMITGISGIIFVIKKETKDYYESSPSFAKIKIFKIPLLLISGFISSVVFLFILYSSLTNNSFSGVKAGVIPWIVLIFVYLSGYIIYVIRKSIMKKNGIDPVKLFSKLPPD